MRFSVVGFVVGALCALLFAAVFTAIVDIEHEELIAAIGALLVWGLLTFQWPGTDVTR